MIAFPSAVRIRLQTSVRSHGFRCGDIPYSCYHIHFTSHLALSNHAAAVRVLLQYSANPALQRRGGETALHRAAKYGHEACVRELLRSSAKNIDKNKLLSSAEQPSTSFGRRVPG